MNENKNPKGRRRGSRKLALRALFGVGALAFILSRLELQQVLEGLADLAWGGLLVALLAQAFGKIVWAVRWRDILRINGVERRLGDLVALLMIGLFFNSFLPTSMGGDLVRGYYTSGPDEEHSVSLSYAVIIVERVLGLITLAALVLLSSVVMLLNPSGPLPRTILVPLALLGLAMTLAGLTAFSWKGWRAWVDPWTSDRPRIARIVADLAQGFDLFHLAGRRKTWILLASFGVQLVGVLFFYGCALAVRLQVPFLVLCLIVPAAVMASMLPISLNGLGLREGALVGLLVAYGVSASQAGSFALLALILATAVAAVGGIIYPFYRRPMTENTHA